MSQTTTESSERRLERLSPDGWEIDEENDNYVVSRYVRDDYAVEVDPGGTVKWKRKQIGMGWRTQKTEEVDRPFPYVLGMLLWNEDGWFGSDE